MVDFKIDTQRLCLRGIEINLFLFQTVDVFVVDLESKCILGLWQVVHLNFVDRRHTIDGNCKRNKWVLRALSLLGGRKMLANRQLGKLSVKVKKC